MSKIRPDGPMPTTYYVVDTERTDQWGRPLIATFTKYLDRAHEFAMEHDSYVVLTENEYSSFCEDYVELLQPRPSLAAVA